MAKRVIFILGLVSLPVALLLGAPLRQWIDGITRGNAVANFILWAGVLICAGAAVCASAWFLRVLDRAIIRRKASALDDLIKYARICRQDGGQLQAEAAAEQNNNVELQHYCEMARMLGENLDLLWRGSDASVLVLSRKGFNLSAVEALMTAAERHYDVEINGPLGANPNNPTEKMAATAPNNRQWLLSDRPGKIKVAWPV